jgi:hypothetical protein
MRASWKVVLAVAVVLVLGSEAARACGVCRRPACSGVPACVVMPAYRCVTEMVPYTVMKTRMRVDYRPESITVMARVPHTTFIDRQVTVCRPVFDTHTVQRQVTVCRPVFDTQYVTRTFTVCRPVTTTRQVTDCVMQPHTRVVAVPVATGGGHCGLGLLCGKLHGGACSGVSAAGCQYVTQTCYTPVPVVRDVVETRMVADVQTRQVPVTSCRMVWEQRTIDVPVTTCRIVQEVQTIKVPVTTITCEPRTITRMVPVCTPETVPVTCYRPVTRIVPVCPPAPLAMAGPAAAPQSGPTSQAPSGQD